ncbi:MAG: L-lysine 6-transaminase [Gemmatimonadota bacterium]|nr:MAG: L-lysine 6-transaminase [Gemmatimonadota bacterium]
MNRLRPKDVFGTLKKHMLVDGYEMVFDLEKSRGIHIYDALEGKTYLDFFTCFATSPIGYNHPKMTTPEFKEKLARVAVNKPSNSDVYSLEMAEFVDTFSKIAIPPFLPHLFLIEGGALAIENGLKVAFDWKVRRNFEKGYKEERGTKVIHFVQAFHGRTGYTLSLTNTADPRKFMYFPKFDWPRVLNPKLTFPLNEENVKKVQEAEKETVRQIQKAVEEHPDDIAALIIEPIQGEGGDNHFRNEFFVQLRRLADEHDFLLMYDEVQTGIGLTGKMWAFEHFDVQPDIIAFGKKTQVCGILAGTRVDEVENNVFVEPSRINSTWGGNIVDMVRCQKYLEIIEEEKLVDHARTMGDALLKELQGFEKEFADLVSNARGRGLMCAFNLPSSEIRDEFRKIAFREGLAILGCGERTIRFRPPLNIAQDELDQGLDIIRKSLKGIAAKGVPHVTRLEL